MRLATRRRRDVVSRRRNAIDNNGLCRHAAPLRVLPQAPPGPQRRVCATTRAEARNEERRRHFVVTASLEQLRRRMQRAREEREEQQRSRFRCVVS